MQVVWVKHLLWIMCVGMFACHTYAESVDTNKNRPSLRFERLLADNSRDVASLGGVSVVTEIIQDSQGFMWFAEYENSRLLRYDGHSYKAFYLKKLDSPASPTTMVLDHEGKLWVGSNKGLFVFNPELETFAPFEGNAQSAPVLQTLIIDLAVGPNNALYLGTDDGLIILNTANMKVRRIVQTLGSDNTQVPTKGGLSGKRVIKIFIDEQGGVWLGILGGGLNYLKPDESEIRHWRASHVRHEGLLDEDVTQVVQDQHGNIWLSYVHAGLSQYDPNTNRFKHYLERQSTNEKTNFDVHNLYVDKSHRLWVALDHGGLALYLPENDDFTFYTHKPYESDSLISNQVRQIFEDQQGNLWVGTYPSGINFHSKFSELFKHLKHEPEKSNSLPHNGVLCIFEDSQKRLWFCTEDGLSLYDRVRHKFINYKHHQDDSGSLIANTVMSISEAQDGSLWLSTWSGGLEHFNPVTGVFTHYQPDLDSASAFSSPYGWDTLIDDQNRLWVGSVNGLNLYQPNTNDFKVFKHREGDLASLPSNVVTALLQSSSKEIWVGTGHGLAKYIEATKQFTSIEGYSKERYGENIRVLYEDTQRRVWIGTDFGATVFSPNTKTFRQYGLVDGLLSSVVSSIIEDRNGDIWFGTKSGLSRLNFQTGEIQNFLQSDGLAANNHYQNAVHLDGQGLLYFGSTGGVTVFDPEQLRLSVNNSPLVITALKINNKEDSRFSGFQLDGSFQLDSSNLSGGKNRFEDMPKDTSETLSLNYKDTTFSLDFALLSYQSSYRNEYAYMLEGFDDDWNFVGQQNTATYTNLNPGNYVFKVRAMNSQGVWRKESAELPVLMSPPPWATWWAYLAYFSFAVGLLFFVVQFQFRRFALEKERKLNSELVKLDKIKDSFLSNTSHELRTPLNGIIGISRSLIDGATGILPPDTLDNLKLIESSGKRLSRLVNDILDFSKIRENRLTVSMQAIDLQQSVHFVLKLLLPSAEEKDIELVNEIEADIPIVYADEDRLQQVLINLIGNAIKFTDKGQVKLSARTDGKEVALQIVDTGIGIKKDDLDTIFDLFSQVEQAMDRQYEGAGLGLALTKQLMKIMGGSITVQSELGSGSVFTISFQVADSHQSLMHQDQSHIQEREQCLIGAAEVHGPQDEIQPIEGSPVFNNDALTPQQLSAHSESHILIVDDDSVNRRVLSNVLSLSGYETTECQSGVEALSVILANAENIDLVLLDVMMPLMSGYEVCSRIRKKIPAHQLPIIFLTAKNKVIDLEVAYQIGANDYMNKPFAKEELLARVETQLDLLKINRNLDHLVEERTRDLNEQHELLKKTQSQLVQSEKMSSLGVLVSGVGHEISNPITYINLSAENLQRNISKVQDEFTRLAQFDSQSLATIERALSWVSDDIDTITDGAVRVNQVLSSLKSFSKIDTNDKSSIKVAQGIESTLRLVKMNYQALMSFEFECHDDPYILGNISELNQVFMNVLVNASQAICQKQETGLSFEGSIKIKQYLVDSDLHISFKDNGVGMDTDVRSCIFDPFYTTKESGTGLGMAISYGIISQHGGEIRVCSEEGEGSEITLVLPALDLNEVSETQGPIMIG